MRNGKRHAIGGVRGWVYALVSLPGDVSSNYTPGFGGATTATSAVTRQEHKTERNRGTAVETPARRSFGTMKHFWAFPTFAHVSRCGQIQLRRSSTYAVRDGWSESTGRPTAHWIVQSYLANSGVSDCGSTFGQGQSGPSEHTYRSHPDQPYHAVHSIDLPSPPPSRGGRFSHYCLNILVSLLISEAGLPFTLDMTGSRQHTSRYTPLGLLHAAPQTQHRACCWGTRVCFCGKSRREGGGDSKMAKEERRTNRTRGKGGHMYPRRSGVCVRQIVRAASRVLAPSDAV